MDLFPRDGKYSHAAEFDLMKGFQRPNGKRLILIYGNAYEFSGNFLQQLSSVISINQRLVNLLF
jgi:Zn-dependent oligopeptidase